VTSRFHFAEVKELAKPESKFREVSIILQARISHPIQYIALRYIEWTRAFPDDGTRRGDLTHWDVFGMVGQVDPGFTRREIGLGVKLRMIISGPIYASSVRSPDSHRVLVAVRVRAASPGHKRSPWSTFTSKTVERANALLSARAFPALSIIGRHFMCAWQPFCHRGL
jgi:hypothetical protein